MDESGIYRGVFASESIVSEDWSSGIFESRYRSSVAVADGVAAQHQLPTFASFSLFPVLGMTACLSRVVGFGG